MTQKKIHIVDSKILILGFTFKENCPDIRNTRVIDILNEFKNYHAHVDVYDPWINIDDAKEKYNVSFLDQLPTDKYDAIILAVNHQQFNTIDADTIHALGKNNHILFDVKNIFPKNEVDGRL